MKKKLRLFLAALALASSVTFVPQPAQAHTWYQSGCNPSVWYAANDYGTGWLWWHDSWDWNRTQETKWNVRAWDGEWPYIQQYYANWAWECGGLGHPISDMYYLQHVDMWRQQFSCGTIWSISSKGYMKEWGIDWHSWCDPG